MELVIIDPPQERAPAPSQPAAPASEPALRDQRLTRFLERPSSVWWTIALGVGLAAPCLFIGFHLDDLIGRFIFSDLPGAERVYQIYAGGYGAANGNPADAQWMMEQGFAPWWMDPNVLLAFYRPLSLATHLLDAQLWPNNAFMWHLHSLLWFAVLIYAAIRTYGTLQGTVMGGLAALLFALDHTHALAVGFATNRYILIATACCLFALQQHHRWRAEGSTTGRWLAPLWYALALLSGESSAAIVGYLLGYALFVDKAGWRARALSLAPYVVTTLAWRMLYNALGRGARGSDLYIDPIREPASFLAAVLERAPILLLGQWYLPPAEYYTVAPPPWNTALSVLAWVFAASLAIALWPLLKRDALARFWTTGMLLALIPMCSGEPNNRLLFVASIGAWGLLARWWYVDAYVLRGTTRTRLGKYALGYGMMMVWSHLFLYPLGVPYNAASLILIEPMKCAFDDVGAEAVGRDAVFVTSPDYFAVRLMRMTKEVEGKPTPARWRALGYGPEQVTITRQNDRSLILAFAGGAMNESVMTKPDLDLYRSRKLPMFVGQQVALDGLAIEVLEVTPDGRPLRVRFDFQESLDSQRYRFYYWADNHFHALVPPALGEQRELPPALLMPELPGKDSSCAARNPPLSAAQPRASVSAGIRSFDETQPLAFARGGGLVIRPTP